MAGGPPSGVSCHPTVYQNTGASILKDEVGLLGAMLQRAVHCTLPGHQHYYSGCGAGPGALQGQGTAPSLRGQAAQHARGRGLGAWLAAQRVPGNPKPPQSGHPWGRAHLPWLGSGKPYAALTLGALPNEQWGGSIRAMWRRQGHRPAAQGRHLPGAAAQA